MGLQEAALNQEAVVHPNLLAPPGCQDKSLSPVPSLWNERSGELWLRTWASGSDQTSLQGSVLLLPLLWLHDLRQGRVLWGVKILYLKKEQN